MAITGGAGFIGRHFVERFSGGGTELCILDLRKPTHPDATARYVIGDIRDPAAVRSALAGADSVLHLAAAHHDFGIDEETFYSVNVGGTRTLCAAMDELGIRRLCFFSSVAVYGSGASAPDEDSPCTPDSPYGASKLEAEGVLREWADQGDGRSVLIIRPTVTFGPGNFANMYTLIRQIASRIYLPVGSGTNKKSLVYIDNIVAATLALWSRSGAPPVDIYNAVDKPDLTSREIAEAIHRGLGRVPPRWSVPLALSLFLAKPFDAVIALTGRNLPVSSARVRKFAGSDTVFGADKLRTSGVRGQVALEAGIAEMARWFRSEGKHLPIDRSLPPSDVLRVAQVEESG